MKSGKQNFSQSTKSSDPTPAVEGQLYYDIGIHAFKYYNGTTWLTLGTGGSSGTIVKTQFAEDDSTGPFTGVFNQPTKLPQYTDGWNYVALNTAFGNYTPLATTNKLFVECFAFGYATVGGNSPDFGCAIFKNTDIDAIANGYAGFWGGSSSGGSGCYAATEIVAGTTSPISFTVRLHSYNSTGQLNYNGRHLGKSWLRVTEYLP